MKIDCCMITTNIQNKLSFVENTVNSLGKHEDKFSQKIMSVDVFPDGESLDWFNKFQKAGWRLLQRNADAGKSMIFNQRNAISSAKSNVVLYAEDDILINKLPKLTTIHKLFNEKIINGRRTGFICFNNYVPRKAMSHFIHDLKNYVVIDDDVFLIKSGAIQDRYYLNFPAALTTKKLFLELQDYAFVNYRGWGVETGMTKAWFDMKKNEEYEVLISLRPEIIDDIKSGKQITLPEFYAYANINFWNNDPGLRHPPLSNRITNSLF